jgi:hypothetical protein
MIGIQKDFVIIGGHGVNYMHGMVNGMIAAHSVFSEENPNFVSRPFRRRTHIRHKSHKLKGRR